MHTKINWFEIPCVDFARATKFYETLFDTRLTLEQSGPVKMAVFMDAAGNASGCVVQSEQCRPSTEGPVIYLDATPSIDKILGRIEPAGGKILMGKMELPNDLGFIGHLIDSEGNRLALHQVLEKSPS
jgi:predicted enzyme related to lactoylglutathione lyase